MNFGNPEKPEIMGQFVGAIKGIGAAVEALDMPIVSGNVSLYNETDGKGILPTPTIGAIGLIENPEKMITGPLREGDVLLQLGITRGHLGQSAILAEAFHRTEGDAPPVDLTAEKAHGDFIRANHAQIGVCTDLSDGGLALAAFELAAESGVGITLTADSISSLFAEDQARYLIGAMPDQAASLQKAATKAGLELKKVGTAGGDQISFGAHNAPLAALKDIYQTAFAAALA